MDQNQEFSAKEVVNNYDQQQLEEIFREYGEVREYKKAASLVIQNRPFTSAKDLADLLLSIGYMTVLVIWTKKSEISQKDLL